MDQKMKRTRTRSSNYTPEEKRVILNIIHKYKHIVENKKTDSTTNDEKIKAWHEIAMEFNAAAPNLQPRTVESIKKFYDNKKKEIRKEVAEERKEIFLTGGGALPPLKKDPNQDLILSIVDKSTIYGGQNEYDSDSLIVATPKLHAESVHIYELDNNNHLHLHDGDTSGETLENATADRDDRSKLHLHDMTTENTTEMNAKYETKRQWKKYKPNDFKEPPSSPLRSKLNSESTQSPKKTKYDFSRRRPATQVKALTTSDIAKKYDILMDRRLEIADLTKKSLLLDIELKRTKLKHVKETKP